MKNTDIVLCALSRAMTLFLDNFINVFFFFFYSVAQTKFHSLPLY